MARIFNDSKTFVDMRLQKDEEAVLQSFKALPSNLTREQVIKFVSENFHPVGHDLEEWSPPDWVEYPMLMAQIKDANLRNFALELNGLWKKLGRNISDEARKDPARSSLIVVPNPFIAPGGRFREYYYWDSYWIVRGLLICGMKDTVKGMIDNFIHLVKTYGFVPNGGRIYYTNRSQPPFLIPTVELYLKHTGDTNYVKSVLNDLEKEYEFWRQNRTVEIEISPRRKYSLSIYAADMDTPRPESYYEDVRTAQTVPDAEKPTLYQDIASAAESGWDFSTRWYNGTGPGKGSMSSMRTRQIVPTDLNSVLFYCEKLLEKFSRLAGSKQKADQYKSYAEARRVAIEAVLWDEKRKIWLDYDRQLKNKQEDFYAASVVPLWAGVHQGDETREKNVLRTLKRIQILNFPGGFPTSLFASGQQWDFPNAWPPLQHMLIAGLAQSTSKEVRQEAFNFAQKWIKTTYKAWATTGHMFEKYNVSVHGAPGGGGEYTIQVGFGWTNGVVLDLLQRYPDQLTSGEEPYVKSTVESEIKSKGCFLEKSITLLICNVFWGLFSFVF